MKPQNLFYLTVLIKTILIAVPANAAPVSLSCKASGATSPARQVTVAESSTWQATIDENLQTASFGEDSPSAATFAETNVKWFGTFAVNPDFSDYAASFLLDRVSGVLTVHYGEGSGHSVEAEFECAVARRKF